MPKDVRQNKTCQAPYGILGCPFGGDRVLKRSHHQARKSVVCLQVIVAVAIIVTFVSCVIITIHRHNAGQAMLNAVRTCDAIRVRNLLKQGADPNVREITEGGDWRSIPAIIQRLRSLFGATNETKGDTALMMAAVDGDLPVMAVLLEAGASPNANDSNGETVLMRALEAPKRDRAETISLLINRGAVPNLRNEIGFTALVVAAASDDSDTIRLLVRYGAGVNVKTRTGYTPLIVAAYTESPDACETLVRLGADVNAVASDGLSAWKLAKQTHDTKLMRILAGAGAIQK